jgi:hypothetical protein
MISKSLWWLSLIPKYLNSMIGSICNCVLPQSLKISAVRHDPCGQPYDSEKRRLRSAFSCLSSISMRQKQLSTSSLLLQSPLKGCLPWELRRSMNGSLKERWKLLEGRFSVHWGFDISAWWLATKPYKVDGRVCWDEWFLCGVVVLAPVCCCKPLKC